MNKKIKTKILLDVIMATLFLALMNVRGTGLAFHEIAGLGIFGLFVAHIALNLAWVKNQMKHLFSPSINRKAKLMVALNAALLLSIVAITLTGIMISEVVFGFGSAKSPEILYIVHQWASYLCLGLFGVHIALHRRYLLNGLQSMLFNPAGGKLIRSFKRIGATAMILGILYTLVNPDLGSATLQTAALVPSYPSAAATPSISSAADTKEESSDDVIGNSETESTKAVSLSEFLGGLFCTGCHNHCPLSNPKCGRAASQIEEATAEYQQLYGSSAV